MKTYMIKINNNQYLDVRQLEDGEIAVYKRNEHGTLLEMVDIIKPEDFVSMLNWYKYQKSNGNESLIF